MPDLYGPFTYTTDDGQSLTTVRLARDLDSALYLGLLQEDYNMSDESLLLSPGFNITSARWFNESCHLYMVGYTKTNPRHLPVKCTLNQDKLLAPACTRYVIARRTLDIYMYTVGYTKTNSRQLPMMPTDVIKNIIEPTIVTVGICGILLTLVVLTRKCMINSCNCYLTALAIGDLMALVIITFRFLTEKFMDCEMKRGAEGAMLDLYSMIIMDIFHNLAVGVTVMLAVERYIAICHPMRAMGMCTVRRARIIIVLLAVASTILMCPRFLDIEVTFARKTSGEIILTATHAYKYDNQLYNYIVTGELLDKQAVQLHRYR
ncbi:hypothetical protein Btru_037161 [Bulinus truncatus]|nr:hypothetical protein Btru_037161 [Bulinus truncatus]